jgi:hypothetical protein
MFDFLMALFAMFMPPQPMAPPGPAPFAWLDGTWRAQALEMTCRRTAEGAACREEGRGEAMRGAEANLIIQRAAAGPGSRLRVELPTVPASTFAEIARGARSVTYEMKTRLGVARLRFTRDGDTLRVERGNAEAWGTTMTYRRA